MLGGRRRHGFGDGEGLVDETVAIAVFVVIPS